MNLYHVQNDETWKKAPKDCRSGFIEAMRELEYSAHYTQLAWEWYLHGWLDRDPPKSSSANTPRARR